MTTKKSFLLYAQGILVSGEKAASLPIFHYECNLTLSPKVSSREHRQSLVLKAKYKNKKKAEQDNKVRIWPKWEAKWQSEPSSSVHSLHFFLTYSPTISESLKPPRCVRREYEPGKFNKEGYKIKWLKLIIKYAEVVLRFLQKNMLEESKACFFPSTQGILKTVKKQLLTSFHEEIII